MSNSTWLYLQKQNTDIGVYCEGLYIPEKDIQRCESWMIDVDNVPIFQGRFLKPRSWSHQHHSQWSLSILDSCPMSAADLKLPRYDHPLLHRRCTNTWKCPPLRNPHKHPPQSTAHRTTLRSMHRLSDGVPLHGSWKKCWGIQRYAGSANTWNISKCYHTSV